MQQKIRELVELAEAEGLTLPYPPDVIARLEESGATVDLVTGAITPGGADQRYRLTVIGEAELIVSQSDL